MNIIIQGDYQNGLCLEFMLCLAEPVQGGGWVAEKRWQRKKRLGALEKR